VLSALTSQILNFSGVVTRFFGLIVTIVVSGIRQIGQNPGDVGNAQAFEFTWGRKRPQPNAGTGVTIGPRQFGGISKRRDRPDRARQFGGISKRRDRPDRANTFSFFTHHHLPPRECKFECEKRELEHEIRHFECEKRELEHEKRPEFRSFFTQVKNEIADRHTPGEFRIGEPGD
jgi:hypothetical protein